MACWIFRGSRLAGCRYYSNEINIHEFLDQIVDMFRMQAAAKGLGFNYARAPNLPVFVRTDENVCGRSW